MSYIDMHCDTLMMAYLNQQKDIEETKTMVDLKRLKAGGCDCQFFAIFMPPLSYKAKLGPMFPKDDDYISDCLNIFRFNLSAHGDLLGEVKHFADLERNRAQGKLSGLLTIEDGRAVEGSMEKLEGYFNEGIRLISLTWNLENCFGFPNSRDPEIMARGLTPFGREAVERMGQLGMLVDVSHLSDGGFRDVAQLVKGPFVASHSNCRALNPHPRSMTDEMIRTLADHGGVMGLNFGPQFLSGDVESKDSRISDMILQLQHMKNVGGADVLAIGSDFDGVTGQFDIGSPDQMPLLFDAMDKAGFTDEEIEKAARLNAERVLREVLK